VGPGSEYIADPAERIAAVAEVAPEFVKPVDPDVVPNPTPPAAFTARQREDIAAEAERIRMVEHARRKAASLVSDVRELVNAVVGGVLLGETGLITPQMVADVRALADVLENRMEATA